MKQLNHPNSPDHVIEVEDVDADRYVSQGWQPVEAEPDKKPAKG